MLLDPHPWQELFVKLSLFVDAAYKEEGAIAVFLGLPHPHKPATAITIFGSDS
jgi:hypothetical protein